eukprot:1664154-Alexandrium_andersonii.AAC.1
MGTREGVVNVSRRRLSGAGARRRARLGPRGAPGRPATAAGSPASRSAVPRPHFILLDWSAP